MNLAAKLKRGRDKRSWLGEDLLLVVLSLTVLLAMGAATMYHFRYSPIDKSVLPGQISIIKDDKSRLRISIHEDLTATIKYRDMYARGTLKLEGAEEDSVMAILRDAEDFDGNELKDLAVMVRMPRTGLQGDFCGPWMVYLSYPEWNSVVSDWFFLQNDGTALVGEGEGINAMTTLRQVLLDRAEEWTWRRKRSVVYLVQKPQLSDTVDDSLFL